MQILRELRVEEQKQLAGYLKKTYDIVKLKVEPNDSGQYDLTICGFKHALAGKFLTENLNDYIKYDFPE